MNVTFRIDEEDYPGRAWPSPPLHFNVSGLPMHINAYRVGRDPDTGFQVAHDPAFAAEVTALQDICGDVLQVTELDGLEGEWVIAAYPHAS